MARTKTAEDSAPKKQGRLSQIRQTYTMTRRSDRAVGWVLLGVFLAVLSVFVLIGLLIDPWWLWTGVGIPAAMLVTAVIFGRRAERAAYGQIEGQPGAAAAALGTLRKGWDLTPAIGVNRNQDVVHRVVGRAGIVLVAEGTSPQRVGNLLQQERRRHARVSPEVPLHEVLVGNDAGQVPLRGLPRHLNKLPKRLRPAEVTELRHRLRALGSQPIGMPKGPLPKSARMPRGGAGQR